MRSSICSSWGFLIRASSLAAGGILISFSISSAMRFSLTFPSAMVSLARLMSRSHSASLMTGNRLW